MATPQDRRLTCRCTRARLHVVLSQIQVWFQNRRQRDRNILRTSTTDGTQAADDEPIDIEPLHCAQGSRPGEVARARTPSPAHGSGAAPAPAGAGNAHSSPPMSPGVDSAAEDSETAPPAGGGGGADLSHGTQLAAGGTALARPAASCRRSPRSIRRRRRAPKVSGTYPA